MNTKSANTQKAGNPWEVLLEHASPEAQVAHDAQVLAFRFLSEVQARQEQLGMNRKELAEKIGTSASYITQLYRGDKLPNLLILARFARALQMEFRISGGVPEGKMPGGEGKGERAAIVRKAHENKVVTYTNGRLKQAPVQAVAEPGRQYTAKRKK